MERPRIEDVPIDELDEWIREVIREEIAKFAELVVEHLDRQPSDRTQDRVRHALLMAAHDRANL